MMRWELYSCLFPSKTISLLKNHRGKAAFPCTAPCSFFCKLSVFHNLLHLTAEARLGVFPLVLGQQRWVSPGATQCFAPDSRMSQGWSQTRGWVRAALSRHQLLFVNCGVSVGLSGLGDLLQQRIEAGRQVEILTIWLQFWEIVLDQSTRMYFNNKILKFRGAPLQWQFVGLPLLLWTGAGQQTCQPRLGWPQVDQPNIWPTGQPNI